MLGAGGASRLAKDGRLAAVPALADLSGPLPPFVGKVPLVLYALWTLVPGLFALPAVLVCVASLGRGCFLMGAVAVGLGHAAFRLLRTAGPGGRVFPGFRCRILAGVGYFFTLGSPWQGKRELESSSFHPLRRGLQLLYCVEDVTDGVIPVPAGTGARLRQSGCSSPRGRGQLRTEPGRASSTWFLARPTS